jgi:hypothetical protein
MADTILHKYSSTAGVEPAVGELVQRELAINTADGKLFTKKADGTVIELTEYKTSYPSSVAPSGYYLSAHLSNQTYTTIAGVANRVNFCPYFAQRNEAVVALRAQVTTAVASAFIRMGVYADDGNGSPTGSPLVTTIDLDASTTGSKEDTVSVSLEAGNLYWLAFHSSSTATVRAYSRLGLPELFVDPALTVGICGWYRNGITFASGLPTLPTVIYPYNTTTPAVFLKL